MEGLSMYARVGKGSEEGEERGVEAEGTKKQ